MSQNDIHSKVFTFRNCENKSNDCIDLSQNYNIFKNEIKSQANMKNLSEQFLPEF